MTKLLQVWQYGQPTAAENGLDDAIATAKQFGFDGLLVKAIDGLTWMAEVDPHADAIGSVDQVAQQCARAHAAGLQYFVWTNPRHDIDVDQEATLSGQLAAACDGLFLDVEPYRQFWNNNAPIGQAAHFMEVVRQQAPSAFIALQPDPRPQALAGIRVTEWIPSCNAIAGQHYWTDFGSDPRAELARAAALGVQFGLPVLPTLPGNADPASVPTDLVAGFPGFVAWRMGTTGPAMLQVLGAIASAAASPAPVSRETPDDYPYETWRQSAIAYRGALDDMGHQVDDLKAQLAQAQQPTSDAAALQGLLTAVRSQLARAQQDRDAADRQVQDLEARIATAGTALGLIAA